MYSKFQLGVKYLQYCLSASNGKGHGIHSPFVFDFITKILADKNEHENYRQVESLRKTLLQNRSVLTVEDYGAGSSSSSSTKRTIRSIAHRAVKSKKIGQLLYRIVKYYQPRSIVELGTSLGVTTSYLALASPAANLFTIEGSPEVANVAKQNFTDLNLQNVRLVQGIFDYTLPAILYQLATVDFAFIDGNHRRQPTENYFHWLLAKSNTNSIFVFDDIHWSPEMEQAWFNIRSNLAVRCSVDLFFLGIVFFRQEFKEKQHFAVRF
ncbi:MAG TPA: class I SAM-dependent methyltransferase [Chitinophagaceae bacterium]|nr:class I SAM-dependent methyltransferase [Chitinophagaceae bacterium]